MLKRNPIQLRRLSLFQTQQLPKQNWTSFVALLDRRKEEADLDTFDSDAIMAFLLLANTNDTEILEKILECVQRRAFIDVTSYHFLKKGATRFKESNWKSVQKYAPKI